MSKPKITTEKKALEVLKQIGDVLKCGGSVEEELIVALRYVPEKLLTPELCLEAMKRYGFFLSRVPKKVLTADICFEAMKHDI